jgi:2-polyprenyl-3-methyl-5-hydroxy-6-metoxy-1,4-benzoquinol methylase
MKDFWDNRYSDKEYVYGIEPNVYFKKQLDLYRPSGRILLPAEGEGRNAVYAARTGLEVIAFDFSSRAKEKAVSLAQKNGVEIDYRLGSMETLVAHEKDFNVVALIYAHFPPHLIRQVHAQVIEKLRPGGYLILEGFSKDHLALSEINPSAGGPKNPDMLFSLEEIEKDFSALETIELKKETIELSEGLYHKGESSVIRYLGRA